jgi:hypothetical protein
MKQPDFAQRWHLAKARGRMEERLAMVQMRTEQQQQQQQQQQSQ